MADSKISSYTALTGANVDSATDLLEIVDTSVSTNKKITIDEFDIALNAKTAHTIGANFVATRAVGVAAAGVVTPTEYAFTFSGDAGGTTAISHKLLRVTGSGSNDIDTSAANNTLHSWSGSATLSSLTDYSARHLITSTGTVATATGFRSEITLSSSGNVTNHYGFRSVAPIISGAGVITRNYGLVIDNHGHANVTTAIGIVVDDFTGSTTMTGINLALSAGSGKKNINAVGTAENYLAGVTGIGNSASSTAALNLAASTTGVSSLRIPHGSAPTSPVNGDIWTTTSGLFVRINGATVGPLS